MKAYKVFNPDFTCRDFQYEVGKTYELRNSAGVLEEPSLCEKGFHACAKVSDCFNYYSFDPSNKVALVELSGTVLGIDTDKQCSNIITVVEEVSWNDMLNLANTGIGNSGNSNSGDRNSGDRNSGYWNSCDKETGNFNSKQSDVIRVFNKECKRSAVDNASLPNFCYDVNPCLWISFESMSDEEKIENKDAFVADGYLKTISYKEAWAESFKKATPSDIALLKKYPNFDAEVFEEITGIKIV